MTARAYGCVGDAGTVPVVQKRYLFHGAKDSTGDTYRRALAAARYNSGATGVGRSPTPPDAYAIARVPAFSVSSRISRRPDQRHRLRDAIGCSAAHPHQLLRADQDDAVPEGIVSTPIDVLREHRGEPARPQT